jgi:hypothetical protein
MAVVRCTCCKVRELKMVAVKTTHGTVVLNWCDDCDIRTCKAPMSSGGNCSLPVPNTYAKKCPAGHWLP